MSEFVKENFDFVLKFAIRNDDTACEVEKIKSKGKNDYSFSKRQTSIGYLEYN